MSGACFLLVSSVAGIGFGSRATLAMIEWLMKMLDINMSYDVPNQIVTCESIIHCLYYLSDHLGLNIHSQTHSDCKQFREAS